MNKDGILISLSLLLIFALGCAIALEDGDPEHWYGFISSFSTVVIAASSVSALMYWRKQERLKYKSKQAAEISFEIADPLWGLEVTLMRYHVNVLVHKDDNHEEKFRSLLIDKLTFLNKSLVESIAFKSFLIDKQFAKFCSSWRFDLAGFESKSELLDYADRIFTSFKSAQEQLIEISSLEREHFDSSEIMPDKGSWPISTDINGNSNTS